MREPRKAAAVLRASEEARVQNPGQEITLTVEPGGRLLSLYDERLPMSCLGRLQIERASHVEPTPDGAWTADLSPVGGPILGPFTLRSAALDAEVRWLQANVLS